MAEYVPTIFDKIISGEIPSKKVYEDQYVFAFEDINPAAPVHVLIVPRKRENLNMLSSAEDKNIDILGRLLVTASRIAKQLKLEEGYRIVINNGEHAGQSVFHLHVHLLGGSEMTWPPGTVPPKKHGHM